MIDNFVIDEAYDQSQALQQNLRDVSTLRLIEEVNDEVHEDDPSI